MGYDEQQAIMACRLFRGDALMVLLTLGKGSANLVLCPSSSSTPQQEGLLP